MSKIYNYYVDYLIMYKSSKKNKAQQLKKIMLHSFIKKFNFTKSLEHIIRYKNKS